MSAANPKGDCDSRCDSVPYDTMADTLSVLESYYKDFDMVSAHWYETPSLITNVSLDVIVSKVAHKYLFILYAFISHKEYVIDTYENELSHQVIEWC